MVSFEKLVERTPLGAWQAQQLDGYYNGVVTLDALGVSLPPMTRVLELVSPFPKLAVDVLCEVLVPEGFILGTLGDAQAEQEITGTLRR